MAGQKLSNNMCECVDDQISDSSFDFTGGICGSNVSRFFQSLQTDGIGKTLQVCNPELQVKTYGLD